MLNPFLLDVVAGDRLNLGAIIAIVVAVVVLLAVFLLPKFFNKNNSDKP